MILSPKYLPKTVKMSNGCLYKGAEIYNNLPNNMTGLTRDKFRKELNIYLAT